MSKLSIIILTHINDDRFLRALQSAQFADEVIVGGDSSENIWRKLSETYEFRYIQIDTIDDFSKTRNTLQQKAKNEWVFFLDSDEWISKNLENEICKAINNEDIDGYSVSRKDIFLHKQLKHGETAHITLTRLARKTKAKWEKNVHEVWRVRGQVTKLDTPLFHEPHNSITSFIDIVTNYSFLVAKKETSLSTLRLWMKTGMFPVGKFLHNYFLRLGFLDGWRGFVYAFVMSLHSLFVRVHIYEK